MGVRYTKTTLSIWLLLTVASFAVFSYLAYHPQAILMVETYQPGASYDRAKVFLSNGEIDNALDSYQRGVKYFKQLYDESGLDRHKIYVSQGLLGIAHIYKSYMDPPLFDEADAYYVEALEWYSNWNLAQPYYSLGETRFDAGNYEKAIGPLTTTIHKGLAPTTLDALFLRGLAYFKLNQYDLAASDWYQYLRFYSGKTSTERWNQFLELRDADIISSTSIESPQATPSNNPPATPESVYVPDYIPELFYILARERLAREEPKEAIQFFKNYTNFNPNDISALYYVSELNGTPTNSGFGERALSDIFPPASPPDFRLWERYVDVYASQPITAIVNLEISFRGASLEPQRIQFNLGEGDFFEIVEKNGTTGTYKIPCSFSPGKSVLRIREVAPFNQPDGSGVFFHSISINPDN